MSIPRLSKGAIDSQSNRRRLGIPTLNHDAVRFVRESLWQRLRKLDRLTRRETIYVTYYMLSLVSVASLVVATVWLLVYAGES